MVIKVLSENTSISPEFMTEHGLSVHIETNGNKILFDTGAGGVFLENAKKLGVNIAEVDYAVLSHGHYDHGGGLKLFMKENSKAPVYVHPKAFERHYSVKPDGVEFIGIDETLAGEKRIIMTGERFFIADGIELFSNISGNELVSQSNKTLMAEKEGVIVQDAFEHEQNLVIREGEKGVLFAGCAHNGIVNIINHYLSIKRHYPDFCLGGFHLSNPSAGKSEEETLIRKIGEILFKTGTKYYTCHCTGMKSFHLLKEVMEDRIEYLAAGRVLEI
jgi:7,8-dihydropterin-6-yl-methyl-4-(beta-D-ribofuranosyl)aminobenzene 5'-phosphate synthase